MFITFVDVLTFLFPNTTFQSLVLLIKCFLDVLEIVIEYHNNYGKGVRGDNYWDWLMILPINLNVLTSGFLAAIEDDYNGGSVRAYKLLLTDMVHEVVEKIENLEPQSE